MITNLIQTLLPFNDIDQIRNNLLFKEILEEIQFFQRFSFIKHFLCRAAYFKISHNFLLYKDKENTASVSLDMPGSPDQNKTIPDTNCNINFGCNKVLLKVIPVTLIGPQEAIGTPALLDEASTISLIYEQQERPTSPLKMQ